MSVFYFCCAAYLLNQVLHFCRNAKTMVKTERVRVSAATRTAMFYEKFGESPVGWCFCCNRRFYVSQLQCGHIISVANYLRENASWREINDINNLLPVCSTCNQSMGDKNFYDFAMCFRRPAKTNNRLLQISSVAAVLFAAVMWCVQKWCAQRLIVLVSVAVCFGSCYASLWFWQLCTDAARWRETRQTTAIDSDSPHGPVEEKAPRRRNVTAVPLVEDVQKSNAIRQLSFENERPVRRSARLRDC